MAQRRASGQLLLPGRRLLGKLENGQTRYFLSDRLSVRLILNSSGNVVGRQGHLPFGEDIATAGNRMSIISPATSVTQRQR